MRPAWGERSRVADSERVGAGPAVARRREERLELAALRLGLEPTEHEVAVAPRPPGVEREEADALAGEALLAIGELGLALDRITPSAIERVVQEPLTVSR